MSEDRATAGATIEDLRTRGFTEEMIEELVKGSAISPEMLIRFGVRPVTDAKAASKAFGQRRQDWEAGRLPAWSVPAIIPFHRDPVLVRAKPRRPFEVKKRDGTVELAKYAQPGKSGVHVFYGVLLRETAALSDASIPLWITEGEKKTMAAESAGLVCLGLFGVSQWHVKGERRLHPEMAHIALSGRCVYLAFDRDANANYRVRDQELELGRALEAAGARVRIVRFPEDAPKLDDFLATHERTELAELIADADKHGQLPPDTRAVTEDWKPVFEHLRLDPTTRLPVKDTDNVARILIHHPAWQGVLGVDVRTGAQLILREPPYLRDIIIKSAKVPRELTDGDVARIADWIIRQPVLGWKTQPNTGQMDSAVRMAAELNRVDAVRDYLVGLKWDKTPRLDGMAVTYFGAPDTAYASAVMAKWMLSAVARAREPGCQVDHVLVLEGGQGPGKSSALRILAGDAHYSASLPHDVSSKDAKEHLCGPWIIELAELAGLRRAELETVKAFITTRTDRFRPAYGRRTVSHPRRCVFAGTTNETEYLRDSTGNRRFWPVACGQIDLAGLERDRDQLWAEALERVRAGEAWHITDPELAAVVEEEQSARREVDPWYEPVRAFVLPRKAVTVIDVLDHLGESGEGDESGYGSYQRGRQKTRTLQFEQRSANRVVAILRDLGWTRRQARVGGARVWRYEAPEAVTSTSDGAGSGDRAVTAQVIDIKAKSPLSPLSPPAPVPTANGSGHQHIEPGTPASCVHHSSPPSYTPPTPSSTNTSSSSDSGDSGDRVEISGSYEVTTLSPLSGLTGDTAPRGAEKAPSEPSAAEPLGEPAPEPDAPRAAHVEPLFGPRHPGAPPPPSPITGQPRRWL